LMLSHPPTPTLFPTRRSSDLLRLRLLGHSERREESDGGARVRRLHRATGTAEDLLGKHRLWSGEQEGRRTARPETAEKHADHAGDRKSTRLNSSHVKISYAVF